MLTAQRAGFTEADEAFAPVVVELESRRADAVIEQGVDELKGNYAADAQAFDPYIRHILAMADMISGGIIKQFPARFR